MRVGSVSSADVLAEGGRLTGGYHLSEDQVAVARLGRLRDRSVALGELVVPGRGLFRGPIFKRAYASGPTYGRPYVSASDLLEAHVRPASYLSPSLGKLLDELALAEGMILVTCSGMNLGSAIWTRPDMDGLVATHDLIRIIADEALVPAGFVYAFLAGRYGHSWIRKQIYGGNIKHVEPEHLSRLPVPRLAEGVEKGVDAMVRESMRLMAEFNRRVVESTNRFFAAVGLSDMTYESWHERGRDLSFSASFPQVGTMRALNFNPRFQDLCRHLQSVPWRRLGDVVRPASLLRGKRFKRVDAQGEHAVQLVGQKHLFWVHPRGRWVARWALNDDAGVEPGTVLMAAQGTLGETELYCRGEFVWGEAALRRVYSEHLMRVVANPQVMPPGCLFAFMRSETVFRLLRSISSGSKQQEFSRELREDLPVPLPSESQMRAIHDLVVSAHQMREEALQKELAAVTTVEQGIEEADG